MTLLFVTVKKAQKVDEVYIVKLSLQSALSAHIPQRQIEIMKKIRYNSIPRHTTSRRQKLVKQSKQQQRERKSKWQKKLIVLQFHTADNDLMIFPLIMSYFYVHQRKF